MKVVRSNDGRLRVHDGYSCPLFWSADMLATLRRHYATTLNDELAGMLGVSNRTVIRKARELGLEKDPEWLNGIWDERRKWARVAAKKKGHPGCFQKGEHRNPDGEFKAGRKASEEELKKHSESMKIRWRSKAFARKQSEGLRKNWDEHPERKAAMSMRVRARWAKVPEGIELVYHGGSIEFVKDNDPTKPLTLQEREACEAAVEYITKNAKRYEEQLRAGARDDAQEHRAHS